MYLSSNIFRICFLGLLVLSGYSKAELISGWDFQTTGTGGTAVAFSPATPKRYFANFGSGTIYFDGTNGSSDWFVPPSGNTGTELDAANGTRYNLGPGFERNMFGAAALALFDTSANGKSAVFRFSMNGFRDLEVSYAAERGFSGFQSHTWASSIDGVNWVEQQTISPIFTLYESMSLNTIRSLDNASNAYLRLTFFGATNSNNNSYNRLDNIQFNASAVPEPTSWLLISSISLAPALLRLRRTFVQPQAARS